MRTPVYGLHPLVDVAVLGHFAEYADLCYFDMFEKRQVRMIPITEHAKADKIGLLLGNAFQRIVMASFPQIERRHFVSVKPGIFNNGMLNRQPMRIPAGNIFRIMPRLCFIF